MDKNSKPNTSRNDDDGYGFTKLLIDHVVIKCDNNNCCSADDDDSTSSSSAATRSAEAKLECERAAALQPPWLRTPSPLALQHADMSDYLALDYAGADVANHRNVNGLSRGVRYMIECLGEDAKRQGLLRTPERVAKAMLFFTKGYEEKLEGEFFACV